MAVAINASAIPGATVDSVACCTWDKPRNEFMMPHTVPNKPIYGLTEPTVARNCKPFSSSISCAVIATCKARSTPSSTAGS
jgi:hypothetical protein